LVPSGTIFFSGCTFECVFCQNYDISTIGKKRYSEKSNVHVNFLKRLKVPMVSISPNHLAEMESLLAEQNAKNINYVGGDPTPNLHTIVQSLKFFHKNICLLWNSNFYNSMASLKILQEIMDLWLPDFKYGNNTCGKTYSGIKNYWDVITRNLKFIYDGGSRDIIIRHLVLPNHVECCTKPILTWIAENIPNVVVNIMGQYHPDHLINKDHYSEINRRPNREEMIQAFSLADSLGIEYRLVS
jgi:putative pyruvate formate lyase activating enzyme